MSFIVNAIGWIISFFASGKAKSVALLPLKLTVTSLTVIAITLYIGAYLALATFFVTLFNSFHDLVTSFNNVNVGDGEAYGITLNSIWNAFLGFLNASGLSIAITTAISLFLTLYFSYFAVKISKIIANTFMSVSGKLNETIRMMD